ncbi:MAG: hypothetical protein JJE35_13580 [Thermoleophilia bacterium]|nr:hypothetical protein [Thermoleophilia bacterium]
MEAEAAVGEVLAEDRDLEVAAVGAAELGRQREAPEAGGVGELRIEVAAKLAVAHPGWADFADDGREP